MTACKVHVQLYGPAKVTSNDIIKGHVILDVAKEIAVNSITIKLQGLASTFVSVGPYSTYQETYKELYQKFELLEVAGSAFTLGRGRHYYDYEFTLPEQLPPSFDYSFANHIDYFLKATVSRPSLKPNVRYTKALEHVPSIPFRNDQWNYERKHVHILVDPRDGITPLQEQRQAPNRQPNRQSNRQPNRQPDLSNQIPDWSSNWLPNPPPLLTPEPEPDSAKLPVDMSHEVFAAPGSNVRDWRPPPVEKKPRLRFLQKLRGRKSYGLQVEVWYMSHGIYLGEPLNVKVFAYLYESMPRIVLSALVVTLVLKTEIRAQSQNMVETEEIEVFRAQCPVKLAASPVLDLSYLLEHVKMPAHLPPSFRAHTMKRSYKLKVALRLSSNVSRSTVYFKNDIKVYSNIQTEALPLYEHSQEGLPLYDSSIALT